MAPRLPNPPPHGFVNLATLPHVTIDPGYATANNLTGAPVPGYGAPGAWLWHEAANALARVANAVAKDGFTLLVWDGYRPARAATALCDWAERTGRGHYITDGWLARRSAHSRGVAVDLTLLRDGRPLDMGTDWDAMVPESFVGGGSPAAERNRALLASAMIAEGFEPYAKEWWHFRYAAADPPPRDVPYGAWEPPEGL